MESWEVDFLVESDRAKAWEELNAPDPCEKMLISSAKDIKEATSFIDIAENRLYDAMAELSETPMEDKVASFLDQLQSLRVDLQILAETYGKGVRE